MEGGHQHWDTLLMPLKKLPIVVWRGGLGSPRVLGLPSLTNCRNFLKHSSVNCLKWSIEVQSLHMVSFEVNQLKWHRMTVKQHVAYNGKLVKMHCWDEERTQSEVQKRPLCRLSVGANILYYQPFLKPQLSIRDKAESLLNKSDSIVSCELHFLVKPHFVQANC